MTSEFLPVSIPMQNVIELESIHPGVGVARSHNGKVTVRRRSGQWWRIVCQWDVLTQDEGSELEAFFYRHRQGFDPFHVRLVHKDTPRGGVPGSPTVAAGKTGDTFVINGFTANQTNAVRGADLAKFPSDNKVYMIVEDADSDSVGDVTVKIWPELVKTTVAGAVVFNNVDFYVLANNVVNVGLTPFSSTRALYSLKAEFVEYIT